MFEVGAVVVTFIPNTVDDTVENTSLAIISLAALVVLNITTRVIEIEMNQGRNPGMMNEKRKFNKCIKLLRKRKHGSSARLIFFTTNL
jgi:hypothetical protein